MNVVRVGTGDVQVSLVWDKPSDIDLHVVDPDGEEIYYGNTASASGGRLDLDSNAGCSIDGVNNENITWASGRGLPGTYTVRVDNWDSCGAEPIEWAVTIHSGDQALQTFTGTFNDAGTNGGLGAGVFVTDFTFAPAAN